jgi:uncharacterized surface protein with fasciclin (FAS1) repeats
MKVLLICLILLALVVVVAPSTAHEDAAHVRFAHFASDAENVDIYVDGEVALENVEAATVSEFLELEPGTHIVMIVPAGTDMNGTVITSIEPLTLEVEIEHNYSVSIIGQADSLSTLVIDETAEMAECDMSNSVFRILVNNMAGSPPISFYEADMWLEQDIEYGGYSAECYPAFSWDTGKAVAGEDLDEVIFDFDSEADNSGAFWEPNVVYFWGLVGNYPGAMFEDYTIADGAHYCTTNVVDFLAALSDAELTYDYNLYYRFDTLIEAIEAAGLTDTLKGEGPFTLFAPTDDAFAALPEGTLDSLMADPEALRDVLLAHVVEGDATSYDELVEAGSVETMQGAELTFTASEDDGLTFRVNDDGIIGNFDYPCTNGRVWLVDNLVLTPSAE